MLKALQPSHSCPCFLPELYNMPYACVCLNIDIKYVLYNKCKLNIMMYSRVFFFIKQSGDLPGARAKGHINR